MRKEQSVVTNLLRVVENWPAAEHSNFCQRTAVVSSAAQTSGNMHCKNSAASFPGSLENLHT